MMFNRPYLLAGSAAVLMGCALAAPTQAADASCPSDDAGLSLPRGFCATVFADGIGHARHMVAAANGVLYVNTWSGVYFGNDTPHAGGFLVALQDTTGTGHANVNERFGETVPSGGHGGTGIGLFNGYLFAETNDKIVKYKLAPDGIVPKGAPQTVVQGLPLGGDHPMHPFAIDAAGNLFVDVASATNSCQVKNRELESPGIEPCVEQETRGGVWLYSATKTRQVFSAAARYATGIRNAEGYGVDAAGHRVFVTQHGRDQLHTNWPKVIQDANLEATQPSEELMLLTKGADYGWPKCYFDPYAEKLVLAPEYGGDGKRTELCAEKQPPVAAYPAHWAPNGMVFNDSKSFPSHYRNGVFIAFHGSWNRAPYAQSGYNVVFQPLDGVKASARCEIFADGFAGALRSPEKAAHRPSGVALAADGALYVSDDVSGRIYRITYQAGANPQGTTRPCPSNTASAGPILAVDAKPPEGTHADAGAEVTPPGATAAMVALGNQIFQGQTGASCTGCHGAEGSGSTLGPNLTSGKWLWSDGSLNGIAGTITRGVAQPKQYRSPMPALGGAQLSPEQVNAVAAYVWTLSHAHPAGAAAAGLTEIAIPGARVFPESITASADGRLLIGSIVDRRIYVVKPGSSQAEPWSAVQSEPSRGIFGVFADDKSNTLWACSSGYQPKSAPAVLLAFDLQSGAPKGSYAMPTGGAFCNDIAVAADGAVYVSDSDNMEIDRLAAGASQLQFWAGKGVFGAKGGVLDGIAVIHERLYVNTLETNKIFAADIGTAGTPGPITEVRLSRAIQNPDGMRSFGEALLVAESGGVGTLSRIHLSGNSGEVTTLKQGFPGGPVSLATVGSTAFVLEGQLKALFEPQAKLTPTPFHALAVNVGAP